MSKTDELCIEKAGIFVVYCYRMIYQGVSQ